MIGHAGLSAGMVDHCGVPILAIRCSRPAVPSQRSLPMPLDSNDHPSAAVSRPAVARGPIVASIHGHPVTCRLFASLEDTEACVAMQREVWGDDFDFVPPSLAQALLHIGGLAIGAFHDDGAMLGFVFSFPGTWDGELIHWSHMLAVRESARDMGIGRTLKELQRSELARRGVARMMWTFDPLQARNAHLNLNRLGVRVVDYVENMYGITRSPLHHGLATDRLIVSCETTAGASDHGALENGDNSHHAVPVLSPFPRAGDVILGSLPHRPSSVLIEIPTDIQQIVSTAPDAAATWRDVTRRHFVSALRDGYRVTGLRRDQVAGRAFYVLQLVPPSLTGTLLDRHSASLSANASPPPPHSTPPFPHSPHHRSDV